MAPKSIKLYLKAITVSLVATHVQFTYAIIFALVGPLLDQQFRMSPTGVNIIFSTIGPIIGFIVQPLVGAMSDKCTFKWGRRRIYFVVGAIITIIGMAMIAIASYIDMETVEQGVQTTLNDHIFGVIFSLIGLTLTFIGANIPDPAARAMVGDIFDLENQQDVYLTMTALIGLTSILCYILCAFTVNSQYVYVIMFSIGIIVTILFTVIPCIFLKEKQFKMPEGEKKSIAQPFVDIWKALKMLNWKIVSIIICNMFGWFAMQPINANLSNFISLNVYPSYASEVGLEIAMYMKAIMSVAQFLGGFIFPFITKVMGEVTTFLCWRVYAGLSLIVLAVVHFIFPEDYEAEYRYPLLITCEIIMFISVIFPAMSNQQTGSLPYSLLRKVVPDENMYGSFIGVFNCGIVIAESTIFGLTSILLLFWNDYTMTIFVSAFFYLVGAVVSIVLYFVVPREIDSEKEMLIIKDEEH